MIRLLCCLAFTLCAVSPAQNIQTPRKLVLPSGEPVDFLIYQPKDATKPLPLLLFLHGGGESGDDLEKVKTHGPPKEIEAGREYPMIVVSPLNPDKKGFWDEDRLARFLDALEKEIPFDPSRLYLVGMSRGANGAYRLAMENPHRFAALVALCGAAPAPYAPWLNKIPTWIIHGAKDPVIPVSQSRIMAEAMEKSGNAPLLTILPEAGHDVWSLTFSDDRVPDWLLKHQRKNTP